MDLCLQFVLGFDSNNFIVISVRPVAIYNGMQVHDFIWLCIGRMAVWNLFGMLHLVALGLIWPIFWLLISVRQVRHYFFELVCAVWH